MGVGVRTIQYILNLPQVSCSLAQQYGNPRAVGFVSFFIAKVARTAMALSLYVNDAATVIPLLLTLFMRFPLYFKGAYNKTTSRAVLNTLPQPRNGTDYFQARLWVKENINASVPLMTSRRRNDPYISQVQKAYTTELHERLGRSADDTNLNWGHTMKTRTQDVRTIVYYYLDELSHDHVTYFAPYYAGQ